MKNCLTIQDQPPRLMGLNKTPDYWPACKALLASPNFIRQTKQIDKDHLSPEKMQRIRTQYLSNPNFNVPFVRKCSAACAALCHYVLMVDQYDRVSGFNFLFVYLIVNVIF